MGRCELLEVRWKLVALSLSLAETWDLVSFSPRNFRLYTGGRGGGVQTFLRRATPLEEKFWGLFRKIWLPENSTQNTTLWKRKMCNSQNGFQPSKWEGGGGGLFLLKVRYEGHWDWAFIAGRTFFFFWFSVDFSKFFFVFLCFYSKAHVVFTSCELKRVFTSSVCPLNKGAFQVA